MQPAPRALATAGRRAVAAGVVAAFLSGCGGSSPATTTTTTAASQSIVAGSTTSTTTSATSAFTLDAPPATLGTLLASPSPTTPAHLHRALDALYRNHPGIASFTQAQVSLPVHTRDSELATCERGGRAKTARAKESARLLGCAPLIFLYYSYAQEHSSNESLAVAREIFGYAVTDIKGPYNARSVLSNLLRSWGLE